LVKSFEILYNMNLKTLLVDDEFANCELLKILLSSNCPNIEVSGVAHSVAEAARQIERKKPDVVFLDVEMPRENGFHLFQHFPKPDFLVVFITAHQHYAIEALQKRAFDYLLKPVSSRDLVLLEQRLLDEFEQRKSSIERQIHYFQKVDLLSMELEKMRTGSIAKVQVPTIGGYRLLEIRNAIFAEAEGNYTVIWLENGGSILVTKSIGNLEKDLQSYGLIRVHKSYLVNLNAVVSYNQADGGSCTLINGNTIPIARRRYGEFCAEIDKITGKFVGS
jgi:two-component system, LytTR family, response regulator